MSQSDPFGGQLTFSAEHPANQHHSRYFRPTGAITVNNDSIQTSGAGLLSTPAQGLAATYSKGMTMATIARSHTLTAQIWKTLRTKIVSRQAPATQPLLFLTQGVFHTLDIQGSVKLRVIRELDTLEALINVYVEDSSDVLSTTVSVSNARLYATTHDIVHQNGGFHSVILKVISYPDAEVVADIYLWEIPPIAAPQAVDSDLALYLPKGSTFNVSPSEEDIVMDRTLRLAQDRRVSVNIRTVEGRSYSTTVTEAEAIRCATPGDYYVEHDSNELSVIYGVTTLPGSELSPVLKHMPLPDMPRPHHGIGT